MTRAPGPAGRESDGARLTHAPATGAHRGPADAPTVALPVVRPGAAPTRPRVERAAPAVPEVPAIADLAAPGRPEVDAVVDDGESAPRRPRPSRHMRARADEMARLLARATPSSRARRGLSSLSSLPAVAAVMGAVAVGGVGIALGLDAERTGVALPDMPDIPAEQTPVPETGDGTGTGTETVSPTANTGVVEALEPDAGGARVASPSSVAAEAARPAPAGPPRATTPTSRPRSTTSPTPSTRTEETTATSSPTPRSTSSPRPTTRSDGPDESDESTADERGLDVEDAPGAGSPFDGEDATAG